MRPAVSFLVYLSFSFSVPAWPDADRAPDPPVVLAGAVTVSVERAVVTGLDIKAVLFRPLKVLRGKGPDSPFTIRYLHDAEASGVPAVDFVPERRYLLRLRSEGNGGWELDDPWTGVAPEGEVGIDALRARAAVWAQPSSAAPDAALRGEVARLVGQLGDDRWKVREEAGEGLKALGRAAAPLLREARAAENDPEVCGRLDAVLSVLEEQRWEGWYHQRGLRHPFTLVLAPAGDGREVAGRFVETPADWGLDEGKPLSATARGTMGAGEGGVRIHKAYDPPFSAFEWDYVGRIYNRGTVLGQWSEDGWFYMRRADAP
jgi:hypothetical protein